MTTQDPTGTDGAGVPAVDLGDGTPVAANPPVTNATNAQLPITASATSPPPQPPASQTPTLDPQVFAPDGKPWSAKFHGSSGALKQVQAEKAETEGALTQQIATLTAALGERDATIAQLQVQLGTAQEQLGGLDDLQGQITTLTEEAAKAQRYKLLVAHPELLNLRVEQQVQVEGQDEPQTVTVNPAIDLIETSSLPLDKLESTIAQMAAAVGSAVPIAAPAQTPITGPTPPTPPAPNVNDLDAAWEKVKEAQERINSLDASPEAWNNHREAWAEYHRLQTELASN
jgi:hypothetical protein